MINWCKGLSMWCKGVCGVVCGVRSCHLKPEKCVFLFLIYMLTKFPSVSHPVQPSSLGNSFPLALLSPSWRFTFFKCILNEKESHHVHSWAGMARKPSLLSTVACSNGQSQLLQLTHPSVHTLGNIPVHPQSTPSIKAIVCNRLAEWLEV